MHGLRAIAHPLRLRILSLLTGSAMSAAEIARELADSQPNISYHLRRLHEAGLVHVEEQVTIRGGTAKRYRHDPFNSPLRARDVDDHLMVATALAAELTRRTEQRLLGAHGSMTDAEFWVTPAAWQEFLDRLEEASSRLHAAAKTPRAAGTVHVSATIAAFRMAP
ncbi:ArsR family transcriptional regulator [Labedaea rhizosphaerae]|uniref:ArsR family transcriptional regulator n=1 Tax=Labedaea rhizosphaerae TaxID=598644 RepID=A0A4R6RY00_LABRH|nr:ArsR family transcriptional regulator [Labedaea rhizosphaerae]